MAAYMRLKVIGILSNVSGFKLLNVPPLFQFVRHKALRRRHLNVLTVEEAENLTRKKNKYTSPNTTISPSTTVRHRSNSFSNVSLESNQPYEGRSSIQINQVNDKKNYSPTNITKSKSNRSRPIIESKTDTNSGTICGLSQTHMKRQHHREKDVSNISKLDQVMAKQYLNTVLFSKLKLQGPEMNTNDHFQLPDSFKYEKVLDGNKQFGLRHSVLPLLTSLGCVTNGTILHYPDGCEADDELLYWILLYSLNMHQMPLQYALRGWSALGSRRARLALESLCNIFGQHYKLPVIMSAKSSKDRGHSQTILLEGRRLIVDAVNTGVKIKSFYFTQTHLLDGIPLEALVQAGTRFYKVKDRHMKVWSDMVTPPGLMCVCDKPKTVDLNIKTSELLPITLICDNIRDAGQLGALIRSAAAACCEKVLVTRGSINAWDPRVLRAAAGAHFRVHIIDDVGWENVANYFQQSQETTQFFLVGATREDTKFTDNHAGPSTIKISSNSANQQPITKSTLQRFDLNVREYDSVDYSKGEIVVIVNSSEDNRSNQDARKLVYNNNGDVIVLPTINVSRDVKLPQALTASIMLFEITRQKSISSENTAVKETI